MTDQVVRVPAETWLAEVTRSVAEGFTHVDWLGCADEIGRSDDLRIVVRLLDAAGAGVRLETLVPRDGGTLASVRHVLAGAAWHERDVSDFFGVTFDGGDPRPLLLRPGVVGHPLRKDVVLAARVTRPWPGGKEPGEESAGARRRMVPPGVPDPEVWGDRMGEPASAADIAASVAGGRVRRRR